MLLNKKKILATTQTNILVCFSLWLGPSVGSRSLTTKFQTTKLNLIYVFKRLT